MYVQTQRDSVRHVTRGVLEYVVTTCTADHRPEFHSPEQAAPPNLRGLANPWAGNGNRDLEYLGGSPGPDPNPSPISELPPSHHRISLSHMWFAVAQVCTAVFSFFVVADCTGTEITHIP